MCVCVCVCGQPVYLTPPAHVYSQECCSTRIFGTVFQELKGSSSSTHTRKYIDLTTTSFFFHLLLLPTSWSSVRPPSVRLCQFHCRPFLPLPPYSSHIFLFSPYVVTFTPALTCTKHMHEPNAKGNFRVSRTDRRLFLFFSL